MFCLLQCGVPFLNRNSKKTGETGSSFSMWSSTIWKKLGKLVGICIISHWARTNFEFFSKPPNILGSNYNYWVFKIADTRNKNCKRWLQESWTRNFEKKLLSTSSVMNNNSAKFHKDRPIYFLTIVLPPLPNFLTRTWHFKNVTTNAEVIWNA